MNFADPLERPIADPNSSCEQDKTHTKSRKYFDPAVSIGMIFVGGAGCQVHSCEDENGADHIAQEFDSSGDDRGRVRQQADDNVGERENGARGNARQGNAFPKQEVVFRWIGTQGSSSG